MDFSSSQVATTTHYNHHANSALTAVFMGALVNAAAALTRTAKTANFIVCIFCGQEATVRKMMLGAMRLPPRPLRLDPDSESTADLPRDRRQRLPHGVLVPGSGTSSERRRHHHAGCFAGEEKTAAPPPTLQELLPPIVDPANRERALSGKESHGRSNERESEHTPSVERDMTRDRAWVGST